MLWNLKEGAVAVGNSRMDYAAFGTGARPMVVIPGLTLRDVKGAGVGLALMYRMFAKDYRVYVLDKKAEIAEGCTVVDLAADVAEAMQALGLTEADVIGISLGGMIAQELAIGYPELVRGLVLGVTAAGSNEVLESAVRKWIGLAEGGSFGEIIRDMLNVMYSERYAKRYAPLFPILARVCKPKNGERFLRLAKACLTCQSYDRLDRIQAPTLVLGGEEDRIVSGEASLEIAERLGCEMHLYEGLGHSAYEEAPDFNQRIKEFFASL